MVSQLVHKKIDKVFLIFPFMYKSKNCNKLPTCWMPIAVLFLKLD